MTVHQGGEKGTERMSTQPKQPGTTGAERIR